MSTDPAPSAREEIDELRRRLDQLEDENQRLKEKLEPFFGPDNPAFSPMKFQRALARPLLLIMLPTYLLGGVLLLMGTAGRRYVPDVRILGLPFLDLGGAGTRHPGVGIGMIGVGGAGLGLVGIGGLGVGIIALGGGSIGVIAVGGGTLGVIAVGGGSCGFIAIGGGAYGYYALGQRGAGKHVLALNRQDDQAIEFFCRWFPRLRDAVTRPMPVIPLAAKMESEK